MNTVNLAFYDKKDWEYFLSIADDREDLHDNWEDWYKSFQLARLSLISQGFSIRAVHINIRELMSYCSEYNLKNNGKTRSQFVATK